jgi:protein TIF31
MSLANAVSHFLNCFLSSCSTPHPQNTLDDVKPIKKRNKRKGRLNRLLTVDNKDWANLTRHGLWSQIRAEIKSYYAWELVSETIESICEHYVTQKISLLRYIYRQYFILSFL